MQYHVGRDLGIAFVMAGVIASHQVGKMPALKNQKKKRTGKKKIQTTKLIDTLTPSEKVCLNKQAGEITATCDFIFMADAILQYRVGRVLGDCDLRGYSRETGGK